VYLIRQALESAGVRAQVYVVHDGEAAIHFFEEAEANTGAPCPHLVILDVNMPRLTGHEVLRDMRNRERCKDARVLVLSSTQRPGERQALEELGVDAFFTKPSDFEEFMKLGIAVRTVLKGTAASGSA